MGKSCCEAKSDELARLRDQQLSVLKVVLVLNATMFVVEAIAGVLAHSTSLLADSLDMFGDALVYAFSIYAVDRGWLWKNKAARLKGCVMLAFGFGVLLEAAYKGFSGLTPVAGTMSLIGATALAANLVCLVLLYRHRSDDINMKSTWICSRNDIIGNIGVLGASALVFWSGSGLPDITVGVGIAFLFLSSAFGILKEAHSEFLAHRADSKPQQGLPQTY